MSDDQHSLKPSGAPRGTSATDHLANERTYLAWVRTSIAVIGLGFAVAKFGTWLQQLGGQVADIGGEPESDWSLVAGVALIVTGAAFAIMAAFRHHVVAKQIASGRVTSADWEVRLVTAVVLLLATAVAILTLLGNN